MIPFLSLLLTLSTYSAFGFPEAEEVFTAFCKGNAPKARNLTWARIKTDPLDVEARGYLFLVDPVWRKKIFREYPKPSMEGLALWERLLTVDVLLSKGSDDFTAMKELVGGEQPDPLSESIRQGYLGDILTAEKVDPQLIMEAYQKAFNLHPTPESMSYVLGLHLRSPNPPKDLSTFTDYLAKLPPDSPWRPHIEGMLEYIQGRDEKKLNQHFLEAFEKCPHAPIFMIPMVDQFRLKGQFEKAEKIILELEENYPWTSPYVYLFGVYLYAEMGNWDRVAYHLEQTKPYRSVFWPEEVAYLDGMEKSLSDAGNLFTGRVVGILVWFLVAVVFLAVVFRLTQRANRLRGGVQDPSALKRAEEAVSSDETVYGMVYRFSSTNGITDSDMVEFVSRLADEGFNARYHSVSVAGVAGGNVDFVLEVPMDELEAAKEILEKILA